MPEMIKPHLESTENRLSARLRDDDPCDDWSGEDMRALNKAKRAPDEDARRLNDVVDSSACHEGGT